MNILFCVIQASSVYNYQLDYELEISEVIVDEA